MSSINDFQKEILVIIKAICLTSYNLDCLVDSLNLSRTNANRFMGDKPRVMVKTSLANHMFSGSLSQSYYRMQKVL